MALISSLKVLLCLCNLASGNTTWHLLKSILNSEILRHSDLVLCYSGTVMIPNAEEISSILSIQNCKNQQIHSSNVFINIIMWMQSSEFMADDLHVPSSLRVTPNSSDNHKHWNPRVIIITKQEAFLKLSNFSSLAKESKSLRLDQSVLFLYENRNGLSGNDETLENTKTSHPIRYRISEIYAYKNYLFSKHLFERVNKTDEEGLSTDKLYEIISTHTSRRTNLQGLELNIAAIYRTISSYVQFSEGEPARFQGGFAVSLLWDFRDMLNFSIRPLKSLDGSVMVNGIRTRAILHMISSGEAEFSISRLPPFPFPTSRAEFPQWLHPTYQEPSLFIIFKQPKISAVRNVYFSPFQTSLWICFVSLLLCISAAFTFISYQKSKIFNTKISHPNPNDKKLPHHQDKSPEAVELELLWVLGFACQQGYWKTFPKWISLKLPMGLACLVGMVIYIAYTTAIISILSQPVVPVRSVDDLILHGFTFATHERSEAGKTRLKSLIGMKHLRQPMVTTDTASEVGLILKGSNALISYWDFFYTVAAYRDKLTNPFICQTFSKIVEDTATFSMFLQRGSPLKDVFNIKTLIVKERGLERRYFRTHTRILNLVCSQTGSHIPVTILDALTAFLSLCTGFGLSMVILLVEHLIKRC